VRKRHVFAVTRSRSKSSTVGGARQVEGGARCRLRQAVCG
jgi:hypothetical protein